MAETPREFFEELGARIDPGRTAGVRASYRFDVSGAGSWHVDLRDGTVTVAESGAPADCVIETSEATFMRIVRREQNPATAYMTGKIRVRGEMALALRLKEVFF